jgi:prolyl oligopeptidase PreP (S9A serine peptidase family)
MYGGFGDNIKAKYAPQDMIWVKHFHGLKVIAKIRGGGEQGFKW